ncbi:MAG: Formyl-CoA transferase, partial [Ilumatobacteraceae bacterium]|nr:Formyl-CoA transferase [Ilumatobacteraceae bacterium]
VAAAQLPASSGSRAGGADGGSIGGVVSSVDGLVYLRLVEPAQWQRLLADIPATAEVARSVVSEPTVLDREAEAINRALDAWAASQTTTQMLESARRLQVPVAPFVDVARLAADDHLVARGYADGERVDLRVPWIIDAARDRPSSWRPPRLRPTAQQPLRGVRILDLTWAWAGPFATTLLAELGAEVINIEWYPRPSNLRVQGPAVDEFGIEGGGWWSANQRGKRSVALDLKHPDAHRAVLELAAVCDAAIENFSPGVSNRLGLGFDDLAARNANLVYLSMSAYGATGPRSSERGYGPHLYASAGYAGLLRGPHGERSQMGIPLADPISGLVAALALTAHLRGPQAVHIDLSELEATCAVRGEPLRSDSPFDAPIRSIADTLRDPYLIARGAWVPDRSAAMRGRDVRIARAPWRMDADRLAQISGAAELGADTREVLIEHVGWNAEDVDRLVSAGAAVDPAS